MILTIVNLTNNIHEQTRLKNMILTIVNLTNDIKHIYDGEPIVTQCTLNFFHKSDLDIRPRFSSEVVVCCASQARK